MNIDGGIAVIETMSLDEYLAKQGIRFPVSDYMLDKLRHPHGLTARKRRELEKNANEAAADYANKRQMAIDEYNQKIFNGEIIPKSSLEITMQAAKYGHPGNESTQAARRVLEKRRIVYG